MESMTDYASLGCFVAALGLLLTLSIIDLKTFLLPNPLNLAFAITGVVFHAVNGFELLTPLQMIGGAAAGGGILLVIRYFGNKHYGQDTLGLGDVKLLAAAGLWLGFEGVVTALTLGAAAGLLHGVIYGVYIAIKNKQKPNFSRLVIPAGPGFAVGIVLAGWYYLIYMQ
jgi:leader peptidase (prepilin peptidase)/N-methyltransferase